MAFNLPHFRFFFFVISLVRASTINTEVYDDRDPPRFYEIQTFYILQSDRKLGNTIMTSNIKECPLP